MRIVAGKFKRRTLLSPRVGLTRPTTDRVRESVFNLVEARVDLQNAEVLDLFAGTGALGLEALSRGASRVVFIESDARVLHFTRKNAAALDVVSQCVFIPMSASVYLRKPVRRRFDLILADPPYGLGLMLELPDLSMKHVTEAGIFVLEHDKRIHFDDHPGLMTSRRYGRTIVSVFSGTNSVVESDHE